MTLAAVVDHKVPIVDGGQIFDRANWWGLCRPHHDIKGQMEIHARETGQTQKLPMWCDDPAARPAKFSSGLQGHG